jgi:hypothetical protein
MVVRLAIGAAEMGSESAIRAARKEAALKGYVVREAASDGCERCGALGELSPGAWASYLIQM